MNRAVLGQTALALGLFGVLGLMLWKNYGEQHGAAPIGPAPFDQRFTDFSARQFTAQGELNWLITGARLDHLTGDRGYTARDLDALLYSLRSPKSPPWHIHADTGTADEKLSEIHLQGAVQGTRAPTASQGELRFTTDALTLWPSQDRAASTTESTLSELTHTGQPRWQSTAQRFTLEYQAQTLTQSQVIDRYNPPRAAPGASP
ncbi:LPS export ABC transporter periplasmic protein LptC [Halothiobacillus sp. DCM-1]|uniref:LPS export ABC transporter periplasmic protein LptC n=1 Tax=Halothiobacillus sp. DCM-1 TaxID=3112558 RepID=UPI00324C169D